MSDDQKQNESLDEMLAGYKLPKELVRRLKSRFRSASHLPDKDDALTGTVYDNPIELSSTGVERLSSTEGDETDIIIRQPIRRKIGRYDELGLLGVGGMGEVLLVRDTELNRNIAMKIIHRNLLDDQIALTRFVEEGQIAAQLEHPHIIPVYELGQLPDGRPYFTMQVVRGRTFREVISNVHNTAADHWSETEDGWGFQRLIESMHSICEAVGAAHERGVIHRDLKPGNIMVGAMAELLVSDWGLAKVISRPDTVEPLYVTRMDDSHSLTEHGGIEGTPAYMPPEQALGEFKQMDFRSDVYSLGAILYEVLCGHPPYNDDNPFRTLRKVIDGPPSPLTSEQGSTWRSISRNAKGKPMPMELIQICNCAMSRNPQSRYPDASAMALELRTYLSGSKRRTRGLKCVHEAQSIFEEAKVLQEQMKLHAIALKKLRKEINPLAPEIEKRRLWEMAEQSAQFERRLQLKRIREEQLLHAALAQKPDLTEAHAALVKLYKRRHVVCEVQKDAPQILINEMHMRHHVESLPLNHPDLAGHLAYLKGRGALSLETRPSQTEVFLDKFLLQNNRLIPAEIKRLGVTPITKTPLDMGSYLIRIRAINRGEVHYPIIIERRRHWNGNPPGKEIRQPIVLPEFDPKFEAVVPSGWFWSGGRLEAVTPLPWRRMWVPAFCMMKYPVTNQDYLRFLNFLVETGDEKTALECVPRERSGAINKRGPMVYGRDSNHHFMLEPDGDGDMWGLDWPVIMIDFHAAQTYATWFAKITGLPWRLPQEYEWEKAARGVDGRRFPWGDSFEPTYCCMRDSHQSAIRPGPVSGFPIDSSPYGVMGMAGNVREWTDSVFMPAGLPVQNRQFVPSDSTDTRARVVRGGCWSASQRYCEVSSRSAADLNRVDSQLGFRLVRSID